MVKSIFTYDQIQAMRPHIQETVNNLLHTMIADGGSSPVDLVEKFALPVPSYIIYGILGVPLVRLILGVNSGCFSGSSRAHTFYIYFCDAKMMNRRISHI
jgi:hypothetical protein